MRPPTVMELKAISAVGDLLKQCRNKEERSLVLTMLLTTALELVRTVENDTFARGWLAAATESLKTPPVVELQLPH